MTMVVANDPLVDGLMKTEGKAEIVDGYVKELPMTEEEPGFAADQVYAFLRQHAIEQGVRRAVANGRGAERERLRP